MEKIIIKKIGDIEIRVNRDICFSAATCVVYAPNTFDIDDKGLAIIKEKDWDRAEKIIAAAQSCPALAIEVYRGGERIYPV